MKTMKKLFALVLVVLLVVGCVPTVFAANETLADNSWTAVSTADQFKAMTTGNYYLTKDIDFGGATVPYLVKTFNGNLEGNGYKLTGFTLSSAATGYDGRLGIFAEVGTTETTTIRNLNVGTAEKHIVATMTKTYNTSGNNTHDDFGFLAATAYSPAGARVVVENVTVYGDFTASGALASSHRVGGFFGSCYNHTLINDTFNGSINLNNTDTYYQYVGGIVGITDCVSASYNQYGGNVVDGCVNNANISDSTYEGGSLAGIIGRTNVSTVITNCENNGDLTAVAGETPFNKATAGVIGGKARGNLVIKGCVNTGTITSAYSASAPRDIHAGNLKGGILGWAYIYGNKDASGNATDDCAFKNLTSTGGNGAAVTVTEIKTEADFANVGKGGIYRLANDITLTQTYTNSVINVQFNGIFDGNGKVVDGLKIAQPTTGSGDVGFFSGIGHTNGVTDGGYAPVVIDFQVGSATNPGKISVLSSTTNSIGGLAGFMGQGSDKTVTIVNCDVFADFEYKDATTQRQIGLLASLARRVTAYDCNTYGSITVSGTTGIYQNAGGLFGAVNSADGLAVVNCNNFADISVSNTSTSTNESNRAGGLLGNPGGYNILIMNSANFGDVYSSSNLTNTLAGGLVGGTGASETKKHVILNCTNFGTVESTNYVAGAVGYADIAVVMANFTDFGTKIGNKSTSTTNNLCMNFSAGTYPSLANYNCKAADFVTMSEKASIRITVADPGLRFRATVSDLAQAKLDEILGDETVSYGILIADNETIGANKFVRDDFTLGTEYIDVATPDWFDGQKGQIAASLTKIPEAKYAVDACATAYADVKVGNTVVATLYANNANAVRNVAQVADAALADVLYVKDGTFYTLVGSDYVVYEGTDTADYKHEMGEADGYTVYSYYSEGAREVLNVFAVAND